jgi:hypothetical protein
LKNTARVLAACLPQNVHIDLNSDLLSLTTPGGVKLVVSERCINDGGAFRWALKFGLCGEISREKISIVIHRNIRCFSPLMVNVEVPVSYQLFNKVRRRARLRKRNDE